MRRLNAALNVLAERGVFALGPTPDENAGTAGEQGPVTADQGLAAGEQEGRGADKDPTALAEAVRKAATVKDIVAEVAAAARQPAANDDNFCAKSADSQDARDRDSPVEIATSECVRSLPETPAETCDVTASIDQKTSDVDEVRGDDTANEVLPTDETEFKVPSHLFDTSTADMDELRAQLGVLTQAERQSIGKQPASEPIEKEILLPVVPQPLSSYAETVSTEVPADGHQSESPSSNGPDLLPATNQEFELSEAEPKAIANARREEQQSANPPAERSPREIAAPKLEPDRASDVADRPQESAYKPVLGTWADLPRPADVAQLDELAPGLTEETSESREVAGFSTAPPTVFPIDESEAYPLPFATSIPRVSGQHVTDVRSTCPTEFEIEMAGRLLETEFGVRVQQLSEQISSQLSIGEPQVVLLVSMKPDRQRAEAIAGLGMYVCGQQILPTLVVDADNQERQITRCFAKHGPGLMETIGGQLLWDHAIKGTSCEKLHVLPCGTDLGGDGDLDQAARALLPELINQWKQRYGLVIIDGGLTNSPLAPALFPYADATFLCVQLGATNREELLVATEQLTRVARLKGCITMGPVSL